MNPVEVQQALERAAVQLDKASTRLADASKVFEGSTDPESGTWTPGPKLLWESQLEAECEKVYTDYEKRGERPPPEPIREARARAKLKAEQPDLWADYERLKSEIAGLQKWIASKKESISARQSILSAEKKLLEVG